VLLLVFPLAFLHVLHQKYVRENLVIVDAWVHLDARVIVVLVVNKAIQDVMDHKDVPDLKDILDVQDNQDLGEIRVGMEMRFYANTLISQEIREVVYLV
jgi:hypothetical protein